MDLNQIIIFIKNNQIIVKVEAPGVCIIKSNFKDIGKYIYIILSGIKEKDEEPSRIEDNIFNGREIGIFLYIFHSSMKILILNIKSLKLRKMEESLH